MSRDLDLLERRLADTAVQRDISAERSERLWARIEDEIHAKSPAGSTSSPASKQWRYVGFAASALAVVVAVIQWNASQSSPTVTPHVKTYSTTVGQRASVSLADGSTVTLAPSTTLIVTGREVELTGEAVFTVNQFDKTPFTVRTSHTTTRVLGTRFGIRRYQEDSNVRVAVTDGKVSVNAVVLSAGDVVMVSMSGTATVQRNQDAVSLLDWTSGRLVFRDTPLQEVALQLSRWYDLDVVLSDENIGERRITAMLPIESPQSVIRIIAGAAGVKAVQNGRIVTISED